MRTAQLAGWFLLDGLELTPAGNPITQPQELPFGVDHLIGFNELLTCKHSESAGVHFFLDDYQFERFWRQPQRYLAALAKCPLVIGPDFSLYTDFPAPAFILAKTVRTRVILRPKRPPPGGPVRTVFSYTEVTPWHENPSSANGTAPAACCDCSGWPCMASTSPRSVNRSACRPAPSGAGVRRTPASRRPSAWAQRQRWPAWRTPCSRRPRAATSARCAFI